MKANKRSCEKVSAKTNTPHSIGSTATLKTLSVSKKSQLIQRKPTTQSKLISIKNENGSKSLVVSKGNTNMNTTQTPSVRITRQKPVQQVESKVCLYLCVFYFKFIVNKHCLNLISENR